MNVELLGNIITSGDWGTAMADGDNFYRMLFRLEKKSSLEVDEIKSLFASYKNWKQQMTVLMQECHSNSTYEDRKAIVYGENLDDDIIKHIETILISVKCEDPNFVQNLIQKAKDAQKMNE